MLHSLKKKKNMVPGISEARDCHHFSTIFCGGIIIIIIMTIITIITTTTTIIIIINSIFLIVLEVAADWSVFFFLKRSMTYVWKCKRTYSSVERRMCGSAREPRVA